MSLVYLPCIAGTLTFGPGRDPYWNNVVLLLHGEGSNGSTTITDSSKVPKSTTATGSTISTAQQKFGAASILNGVGTNFFTTTVGSPGTMTGDFTFEAWLYNGGNNVVFYAGNSTDGWYAYSGQLTKRVASSNTNIVACTTNVSTAWHHFAISRTAGTFSTYYDGTRIATASNSDTVDLQTIIFGKYVPNNNLHYQGNYDEVRVTKSVGRYSGTTITVPARKFPDS